MEHIFTTTEKEEAVLQELCRKRDITPQKLLLQGLRLAQLIDSGLVEIKDVGPVRPAIFRCDD